MQASKLVADWSMRFLKSYAFTGTRSVDDDLHPKRAKHGQKNLCLFFQVVKIGF